MIFLSLLPIVVKAQESSDHPRFPAETIEDVRYYMVSNSSKMTWFSAKEQCRYRNMTLALPRSTEENGKLLAFMVSELGGSERFWIGATDAEKENYFHDSEGTPILFSYFAKGQPDDYETGEDCVEMPGHNLFWNDVDCAHKKFFACESRTTRYLC